MNAVHLQDSVTFNCDVQAVISITQDDIFWYKLDREVLSQLPPNGTSCGELFMSGSGSGSTTREAGARREFNITGDIVANGNYSFTLDPIQFGDEGYYACVVQSGSEQKCFSNYVTVVGE